ncbi:MAG TPA: DUF3016 domain-containing protein [Usitatibacteraceae bacterium]
MNTSTTARLAMLFWLACAGIGAAGATVTVTFVKPEGYADMPWSIQDRERVFKDLTTHFNKLGATLAPDQDLKLEILDLQLAGRMALSRRGPENFRILRGAADWPSMRLRYTLESKGTVLKSGEDRLSDMDYLHHGNSLTANTPLRYEKRMIDDWFKSRILAPAN